MKSKTSRTVVLMTPATMFEKFFARWLVATCGFILVFLIAFKLADLTRVVFYLLATGAACRSLLSVVGILL